ncbi:MULTISPECIES: STAS domain-containing protein [Pseudomonas]|jgi:phospholipid transport system transporter-binding protein|uniref:STAS domain-containing protein n=1 Tax=Pseudomonas lutea TaxID=243924 RepID=A0ABR9A3L1_9PSED|nr:MULTISPECIES: STAS domain-containing protein [Pseudomonas]MBD8120138.1 STAS domain-containing protein [Pseudomonas lutea]
MSQASVTAAGGGELMLTGVIDYRTGPALREQGAALIKASIAAGLTLDCSGVQKSSSVGLALILAFMRDAQALNKSLTVQALPEDMQEIAQVSGLTELLQHH